MEWPLGVKQLPIVAKSEEMLSRNTAGIMEKDIYNIIATDFEIDVSE